MSDIFFDSRKLPRPKREYVAFLDIMGTKAHMTNSVYETANYIFKLHAAVLSAWRSEKYKNVFVYPVMDGAYITASNQGDIEKILVRVFDSLASIFLKEPNICRRFSIQAGLSYGETIHGHRVPYSASKVFELDLPYKNNILLGSAMIQAYELSSTASPFGIAIAESAQKHIHDQSRNYGSFHPGWKWHESKRIMINTETHTFSRELIAFFEQFRAEDNPFHYEPAKIDSHIEHIKVYFG